MPAGWQSEEVYPLSDNFLEKLIVEWYELQGYFVRRNVQVGRLASGGYEAELNIVAFAPAKRHLVHVEPSMDADSWSKRDPWLARRLQAGRKHIPGLFDGVEVPAHLEQIAVLGFTNKRIQRAVGGGRVVLVSELLETIFRELRSRQVDSRAVPEHLTLLRTLQFVHEYRNVVMAIWERDGL